MATLARAPGELGEFGVWPFDSGPSGAFLVSRALNVLGYINTLHAQILSSSVDQAFKDAWGGFYRSSANYLVAVITRRPVVWIGTEDVSRQIELYATQAIEWRGEFQRAGGHPVGPAVVPIEPEKPGAPWWLKWGVGAGVVALVGYGTWRAGVWSKLAAKLRKKHVSGVEFAREGW